MALDLTGLEPFIVTAKRACYAGGGGESVPSRLGAHDIAYEDGRLSYRDSYFGGSDFLGQEVVWLDGAPIWAMNYYGHIVRPYLIDAARAGATIKAALMAQYREGRFLGGFEWTGPHGRYVDSNGGDHTRFRGRESIFVEGAEAYTLEYFGGLIKP